LKVLLPSLKILKNKKREIVANKQKRRQRERARHASQQSVFYVGMLSHKQQLVGQSLSALCASSFEYVSAISSLHSLSEAVLLLSLTLFRLVSSKHRLHLL